MTAIDPYLIWMYRLTPWPIFNFLFGTLLLALLAILIGEYSIALLFHLNHRRILAANQRAIRRNEEAVQALKNGEKGRWRRLNRKASDAWGRSFFMQLGMGAGSLWPLFIALGWMQTRFAEIRFPLPFDGFGLFDGGVGYVLIFLSIYIAVRILFRRMKPRLPGLRTFREMAETLRHQERRMFHEEVNSD